MSHPHNPGQPERHAFTHTARNSAITIHHPNQPFALCSIASFFACQFFLSLTA
jgi:hypothetical protein